MLVELEEFKEAYLSLLEKSKEIANNKDYSADAKALGLEETDPTKWRDYEKESYITHELIKMEERLQIDKEFDKVRLGIHQSLIDKMFNSEKFKDDETQFEMTLKEALSSSQNVVTLNDEPVNRKEFLKKFRNAMTQWKNGADHYIESLTDVRNFEVVFLTLHAVYIFHILTDIMFFRSTMKWPNSIRDKETLSQMYSIVYSRVNEIQIHLSNFLNSIKVGLVDSNPARYIASTKSSIPDANPTYYITYYQMFNIESEIRRVMDTISKLNEEIRDFGYLSTYHKFRSLDEYYKEKDEIVEGLKGIEMALSR